MQKQSPVNHGEGDPEAAGRFNESEREFVNSPQGQRKIKEGPKVGKSEEAELSKAEQIGRDRSKGEDSASEAPRSK